MTQTNTLLLGGIAAVSILLLGSTSYYIIQQDKKVKRKNSAKVKEHQATRLLRQISSDHQTITVAIQNSSSEIKAAEGILPEKEYKKVEFSLLHSNELLLRLMERLDAIRPWAVIMEEDENQPTEDEEHLIAELKQKKKRIIFKIDRDFQRLDSLKETMSLLENTPYKVDL
ncbi:hypothetical protein BDF14DRAFT_1883279 [Spinellus fusiger]|nr:hypothetical protein BDF14DRAFT_1883279 [Spinellus fusiger]